MKIKTDNNLKKKKNTMKKVTLADQGSESITKSCYSH